MEKELDSTEALKPYTPKPEVFDEELRFLGLGLPSECLTPPSNHSRTLNPTLTPTPPGTPQKRYIFQNGISNNTIIRNPTMQVSRVQVALRAYNGGARFLSLEPTGGFGGSRVNL